MWVWKGRTYGTAGFIQGLWSGRAAMFGENHWGRKDLATKLNGPREGLRVRAGELRLRPLGPGKARWDTKLKDKLTFIFY